MPQAEMVKPALRDAARWADARCNDGTPFGFRVQLSATSSQMAKWVIQLQGGGFCDDTSQMCSQRSSNLTTTPSYADRDPAPIREGGEGGIFRHDAGLNPTFYDANWVLANYCSSDGWSGATNVRRPSSGNPQQGWYFSGHLNVRALIETLKNRYGLNDANPQTQVLFTGSSAGGMGVQANAELVAQLLPQTAAAGRLKLVNDGGLITNFDNPNYRPGSASVPNTVLVGMVYDFWAAEHLSACVAAQAAASLPAGLCFMGTVNYPFITAPPPSGLGLPMLVQYSSIDSYAVDLHHIDYADPVDLPALEQFRQVSLQSFEGMDWVFSGGESPPYHTVLTLDQYYYQLGPLGSKFREVLTRFWQGSPAEQVIFGNPTPSLTPTPKPTPSPTPPASLEKVYIPLVAENQ
jgi:hypothetical protein